MTSQKFKFAKWWDCLSYSERTRRKRPHSQKSACRCKLAGRYISTVMFQWLHTKDLDHSPLLHKNPFKIGLDRKRYDPNQFLPSIVLDQSVRERVLAQYYWAISTCNRSRTWNRRKVKGTQWLLSVKYLLGEAKIAKNFYSFRKAKNFKMTTPFMYNFRSLISRKRKPKIFRFENVMERGFREILTFVKI